MSDGGEAFSGGDDLTGTCKRSSRNAYDIIRVSPPFKSTCPTGPQIRFILEDNCVRPLLILDQTRTFICISEDTSGHRILDFYSFGRNASGLWTY